jgi:hypothetical protein
VTKDEALRMALEYLEESDNYLGSIDHSEPIAAIKQVLAQPEERYTYGTPLLDAFTTPPAAQRQWVGLTDKDISDTATTHPMTWVNLNAVENRTLFARILEAKLKEKNT